jgi:hypothetical protein
MKALHIEKMIDRLNPQDRQIYDTLVANGYAPFYWIAVSRFETGDYTSNLYLSNNNLFGMRKATTRPNTAINSTSNGFAIYLTKENSILDLIEYLKWFNYPSGFATLYAQVQFMKEKGYFEEPFDFYYSGVKNKFDKL